MEIFYQGWVIITLSILSGILYRMGGSDSYDTKWRDMGCPAMALITLFVSGGQLSWWWVVCFGLHLGSMTTYWKKKGTDAHWYNWVFTGLGYSLAYLPYAFLSGIWAGFLARIILTTAGIVWWSQKQGDAVKEEFGRGFIQNITIPILTIG